ncbi:XdhC family protein [Actimicrobium antarcticum]|uniref:XdhC family protein n=1 Tax=Actimicrobium antarcticum TaxID=1051899 RepID=A0ABP7T879_9BURK
MMTEPSVLPLAAQYLAQDTPFVVVTVIRAASPTSAYVGAQALVDGAGTLHGWVGGGCAQGVVITAALQVLQSGEARLIRISNDGSLSPADVEQHAMPCASNGSLELFLQSMATAPLLVVLGTTPAAQECRVLGQRMGLRVAGDGLDLATLNTLQPRYVLVATQGDGDEAALDAALRSSAVSVLMIASARKANQLRQAMQVRGIPAARIAALHAPAGPDIHAHTPVEIALAAIAAVVTLRRAGAPVSAFDVQPLPALPANLYINPVCGKVIDQATAKHVIELGGMTHYFCCDGCKVKFDLAPDKYLAIARTTSTGVTA